MNYFKNLLALLFGFLFSQPGWSADLDFEAIQREKNRKLVPIDVEGIRAESLKNQALMDKESAEQFANEGGIASFIPDDFGSPEVDSSEGDRKRIQAQEAEYQANLEIERGILKELKIFSREHPVQSAELSEQLKIWQKKRRLNESSDVWPSDLAQTMAQFLKENQDTSGAEKLLELSLTSPIQLGDSQYLALGESLVGYFNGVVSASEDVAPTSELFSAVIKAIRYFEQSSADSEYSWEIVRALKQTRDMMVRWPLSPLGLERDAYYPTSALLKIAYKENFVDRLIADMKKMKKIFQSYKFQSHLKDGDLLGALYDAGFYGVSGFCGPERQFIWVNPQDYIVRVKFSPSLNRWEYTVGLTLFNPLNWSNQNSAISKKRCKELKRLQNVQFFGDMPLVDDLVTHAPNEVFKIAMEGDEFVTIMPAFKIGFYWHNPIANMDPFLRKAHRELKIVGQRTKSGIDFSKIDSICSF